MCENIGAMGVCVFVCAVFDIVRVLPLNCECFCVI